MRRSLLAAGLTGAALLGGLAGAVPAAGVSAGAPVTDPRYAFTAQVRAGDAVAGCTGVLISPLWVLTARDCLASGAPARVVVGRLDLADASRGAALPVERTVSHPTRNVALLRLPRSVAVPAATLATTPAAAGDDLHLAGFGRTAAEWVPDVLHSAPFDVAAVSPTGIDLTGSADACRGDAGGPVVREAGGRLEVVGLAVRSAQRGCLDADVTTGSGTVAERVDDLGPWIAANAPVGAGADERADLAAVYTYANGEIGPWTFPATANGGFAAPVGGWKGGAGGHTDDKVTALRGDYTGDHLEDDAVLRGTAAGGFSRSTFAGRADGSFGAPLVSWTASRSFGTWASIKPVSGDFTGDGRADVAFFYGYGDGKVAWWVFAARPDGGFADPVQRWSSTNWGSFARTMVLAGDFTADGRADAAAFFQYADGGLGLFVFPAQAGGAFAAPVRTWNAAAWGTLDRMKAVADDVTGDGRADVAVLYDYPSGHLGLSTWVTRAAGGAVSSAAPLRSWYVTQSAFGSWDNLKLAAGDFTGDGRAELAGLYHYGDGGLGLLTWRTEPTGAFAAPTVSWRAAAGTFGQWARLHPATR